MAPADSAPADWGIWRPRLESDIMVCEMRVEATRELVCIDLGRCGYADALRVQERYVEALKVAAEDRAHLILVEHDPPVITLGRGADAGNIVASRERIAAEGIEVHETSRGGEVTYHGPGQLVGYPILRVDLHGRDLHRYLRDIEEVLIRTLGRFGIVGKRTGGLTGVWVDDEKVAAIGVAVTRWVSYHGFALNVRPNLEHFELIVPCGIPGKHVTSLSRLLGRQVAVEEVKPPLRECFAEVFGFDRVTEGRP